ncbi:MAG: HEAT repeat domain-containing protein [Desulfobulbus sp.]|nr:HEAT repeat domain-containing protein [Desulfobulbus sp.]
MVFSPTPLTLERSNFNLGFPIRLYTALQTIRLYPPTSPQVQRCNDFLFNAFQALLAAHPDDDSVTLAFSDGKIFVCGDPLQEKDQTRQQIQGLIALFRRFNIHSFTFHSSFSAEQCATFIHTASALLGDRNRTEAISTLLAKAGITSVAADIKQYVAIHEGEQVVQETVPDSKLALSDEKPAYLKMLAGTNGQQNLPETVRDLLADHQDETADTLPAQLISALRHESPPLRTAAFHSLAAIGEYLVRLGRWERVERLLPVLQEGLQVQGVSEHAAQQALAVIGGLADHHLAEERYTSARNAVQILHLLATQDTNGTAATDPSLQHHALDALATLCSQAVLEKLMQLFLHSETHREAAGNLLVDMGVESAKFQLQQLISNESWSERKQILGLIRQTGNPARSILHEQLHKEQPWYVVRNVIRLLGEISSLDLFTTINPFIGHPDLRVQQEVLSTAGKVSGEDLKSFLLQALQTVDDSLKIRIVNQIAANHDERFIRPLTDLLEGSTPLSGKNKNDLQRAICKTLGVIGSKRASASLSRVLQSKNAHGGGYSDEVRQAATMALERIRAISVPRKHGGKHPPSSSAGQTQPASSVEAKEAAIFHLLAQGDREQAKKQLFDLITATARAGDFKTAERLRERMYEIDSQALSEIIRSGEIIEEAKMGVKDEALAIWSNLTDQLTAQEFQALYRALSECRFNPEETVVSQGSKNDALFFITQGSVKVSHQIGARELFITTLNRGQIAGENFFSPSLWTVSLTALTPLRVHVLQQAALNIWQEQFPGLRAKLHAYYLSCNVIGTMLEKKGLERRSDQRFLLARKIQVQPISNHDNPIGRGFHAETADISYGGLAFLVRISHQGNARLLLARRMHITLPVGGKDPFLTFKGMVIGIQPFNVLKNDFSVHLKFDHPLERKQLQAILG